MDVETLDSLVDRYRADNPYPLQPGSVAQLQFAVRSFSRSLGRPARSHDLTPERFNAWVDYLSANRAAATARSQRGSLLAIWRWAHDAGLIDTPPLRIRRLRPVRHCPQAWTLAEVAALIDAADHLAGQLRGQQLPARLWWGALLRTAYETALRLGDLLALRWVDLEGGRCVQQKTGQVVQLAVRPATLARLDQLRAAAGPRGQLVFPLAVRRESFYRQFARLVALAGIRRGTFRWIRRSAITQLERVSPGQGTRLAGHRHRSTTEAWYIDRAQLDPAPLPPDPLA